MRGFEPSIPDGDKPISSLLRRHPVPVYGGARLANENDLARYWDPAADPKASMLRRVGYVLEGSDGGNFMSLNRDLYLPAELRRENMLFTGLIGSGKTQRAMYPLIYSDLTQQETSIIVFGVKGDLEPVISGLHKETRPYQKLHVINLTNRHRTTKAWNPYADSLAADDALLIANLFCAASQTRLVNHDSQFWDHCGSRYLAALMMLFSRRFGSVCPADVHHALELPRPTFIAFLRSDPGAPFAEACASFLECGSHNAETVLATVQSYMRSLLDPNLAAVTSQHELDFAQLFDEPTVLVVEADEDEADKATAYLNLFASMLFRKAAAHAKRQPGCRLPRPLSIYFDDFAALGRITEFPKHANLLRSRNVRIVAAIQTLRQLFETYPNADSVLGAFKTKVFFSPVELSDAEWASRQAGTATVACQDETERPYRVGGDYSFLRQIVRPVGRPLLLPEEIRLGPESPELGRAATVFFPDIPPFQAWFPPAFALEGLANAIAAAEANPPENSLRDCPLEWNPPDLTTSPARPRSKARKKRLLKELRTRLGWSEATEFAKLSWADFEATNESTLDSVIAAAEELLKRKATINEFALACKNCGSDYIPAALAYMEFVRRKVEGDRRKTLRP